MLGTAKNVQDFKVVRQGNDFHFGLKKGVEFLLNNTDRDVLPQIIHLSVNIDGVSLFKSSIKRFWCIIGSILEIPMSQFIVGLYFGEKKPQCVHSFLEDLINELWSLCIFQVSKRNFFFVFFCLE